MRRALSAAAALGALALLVPAAHASLQDADVAVRVSPSGAVRRRADHDRRRVPRRLPRHPAAKGRVDRSDHGLGGLHAATRGGSTKLGSIDRSDTFNYEINGKRVRIIWHFRRR
jgi:hypothetical protein